MMEGFGEIMTFEETIKYKMAREGKIPAVKIRFGKNDKVIIRVPYNQEFMKKVKTISGRRWNSKEKYREVPYSEDLITKLQSLSDENLVVDSYFYLFPLQKEFSIRKYSRRTIKSYMKYNRDFLLFLCKKPKDIDDEDIKKFLYYVVEEKKVSTSTLNIIINALKFYYGEILKKNFIYEVKRPKKDKKLPVVLSREEVKRILDVTTNIKHKAILMLMYSGGLRVGEVVRLKPKDIDSERGLIHIKGSKGRKDRCTILSQNVMVVLREYYTQYKPKKWLFEGAKPGKHISIRIVHAIFKHACAIAGIKKDVSAHSLRHSFATYLLEGGVDLRFIQEILGHKSSKTTEIYTHVSKTNIARIKSPLYMLREERT